MSRYDYDLFTIGAGSGGVRATRWAAGFGARAAIAEERYLGGTCVNVGCIPKKLFSYAAHFHEDFKDAVGYGWRRAEPGFGWKTLVATRTRKSHGSTAYTRNCWSRHGRALRSGSA